MTDNIYGPCDEVLEIKGNDVILFEGASHIDIDIKDVDSSHVVYKVISAPICCYDQHSRARVGARFFNYEVNENPYYHMYTSVFKKLNDNEDLNYRVIDVLSRLENLRNKSSFKTEFNLMSRDCSYYVDQTYQSLKGQMARRLMFCEEEFVAGLHWHLRDVLINDYKVEVAKIWLPECDNKKKCVYAESDYLSNMFGCLFAPCGRWPAGTKYASFNTSCSDIKVIEDQMGIVIPRP